MAKLTFTDYDTFYALGFDTLPSANGTLTYYRMNAPLSPTGSGAGVVIPAGFTEYSAMYSRYRVVASSIRVEFDNTMQRDGDPLLGPLDVFVTPYCVLSGSARTFGPNITSASDVKPYMGNPYTKKCQLAHALGAPTHRTLYNYISMEKAVGATDSLTCENYTGNTGAGVPSSGTNPSQLTYWLVGACTHNETLPNSGNLSMLASVTYWVEFFGRDFELN